MAELILKLKERELKRVPVNKAELTIGRDPDNDLCIDNIGVSRTHAKVTFQNGRFILSDNGSSNGSFVNGVQVDNYELKDGDQIQVGKYRVVFSMMGQVPMNLSTPSVNKPRTSPAAGNKKVKNVFGTVQFTADEIQKLVKDDPNAAKLNELGVIKDKKAPVKKASGGGDDKTKLLIGLLGVTILLIIVLVVVILTRG